ncbi:MAG: glycoside-pentoside-hexuronide (GPH):cation symporter [Pseudomonadota bacterium]
MVGSPDRQMEKGPVLKKAEQVSSPVKHLVGYGVGDLGLNIYWNTLSLLLIYWYTNVVGLPPAVAGLIYFVGLLWDGVTDPLVASLAQRNTSRYGTYRPFLVVGGFILAAAFVLLFWRVPLEGSVLIAALVVVHILFRTAYTIVAVPYSALSSRLSFDSVERTSLSGARMFGALTGLLIVSTLWFPTVRFLGGGDETSAWGFSLAAFVGAAGATICLIICFLMTEEKAPPGASTEPELSLRSFWSAVRKGRGLHVLLALIFFQACAHASFYNTFAFYIDVNAGSFARQETILSAFSLATLISVPLWTLAARRFGKRRCWVAASVIFVTAGLHLAITKPLLMAGIPLQITFFAIGSGAYAVLIWSFVPDMVEYVQWEIGERNEAVVFGSVLLVQKVASGTMGFAAGLMLSMAGFDAAQSEQSAATIRTVSLYISLVPSVCLALSLVVLSRWPISRARHAQIVAALQERGADQGRP